MKILALALLIPIGLTAQTVDQSQANHPNNFSGTSSGWTAQSFTPTATTSAGAGFWLAPSTAATDNLTVELWNALPSAGGATKLATGTVALGQTTGYFDAFWAPVAVTPGNQYFLAFATASGNNYDVYGDGSNPYAGGSAYYNYQPSSDTYSYQTFPAYDVTFREYSADVTTTPEPSSFALLGTGLFGLVPMLRRRK